MSEETRPSNRAVKLSQAATLIPSGVPRALWCGTAGTLTGVDASGNTITNFPLQAGLNPIQILIWSGGTAADVWGLY